MDNLFIGKSCPIDPSKNCLFIKVYFYNFPSCALQYKSVAPYTKGMAQLAADALHINTFGAVR